MKMVYLTVCLAIEDEDWNAEYQRDVDNKHEEELIDLLADSLHDGTGISISEAHVRSVRD